MTNEELAVLAASGDTVSANRLYAATAPLIRKLASQYFPLCAERMKEPDDLIQQGYFAVLKAAKAYDPARSAKFTTVLGFCVKTACREELGLRGKKQLQTVSLDAPVGDSDDDYTLSDTLASTVGDTEESIWVKELREAVHAEVEKLPPRERATIRLYHFEHLSLSQIADKWRQSRVSISNNLHRAYYRLSLSPRLRSLWADYSDSSVQPSIYGSPEAYVAYTIMRENALVGIDAEIHTEECGLELI